MAGKIFVALGVVLLAIQAQRIVTASPISARDLESLKEEFVAMISKAFEEITEIYDYCNEYCKEAYAWVDKNEQMNDEVKKIAQDSIETILNLAAELQAQGEKEGKPEEYFECFEKEGLNGMTRIQGEADKYVDSMREIGRPVVQQIENRLYSIDKIFKVMDGMRKELIQEINSSKDEDDLKELVEHGIEAYENGGGALTYMWEKCVTVFMKFKSDARDKVTESEKVILEFLKDAQNGMRQC